MTGATRIAAVSRSLRPKDSKFEPATSNPAARDAREDAAAFDSEARSKAAKTFGVGASTRGLTRTAKISGKRIAGPSSSPIPLIVRACGERQARTSAPVARAEAHTRGSSMGNPASFARDRRAAAASAEPPPSPAAAGNRLTRRKRPSLNPGIRPASDRAARKTRFLSRGPASFARGPRTSRLRSSPGSNASQSHSPAKATKLSRS